VFSSISLCGILNTKEKCFRLQRYIQGRFESLVHEHVPRHRISLESATEVMRAFVIRFQELSASEILRCHLNGRGKQPAAANCLAIHVDYPEPGVVRRSCGEDIVSWMDEVIDESVFRK
jgi:hypothetical protein